MQRLLAACLFTSASLSAAPAMAVLPDGSGVATLQDLRPPQQAALAAPRGLLGLHSRSSAGDGSVAYLGRVALPPAPPSSSLVSDPALPVIAYFQNMARDESLELQLQSQTDDGGESRFAFVQSRNGVPILGTFALAQLQDGMLHYARHFLVRSPHIDTLPTLAAGTAQALALGDARTFAHAAVPGQAAAAPAIYYAGGVPTLVYVVPVRTEQPFGSYDIFIDAHSGAMLGRHKTSLDAVSGEVTANVEASCQGEAPTHVSLPFVQWTRGLATGADGSFTSRGQVPHAQVKLAGPYFRIDSYGNSGYSLASQLHQAPAFNEVQLVGAPMSQVDPFYYATQVRAWLRRRLGEMPQLNASRALSWTNTQFPIRVNLPSGFQNFSCNAFYDGTALNFYVGDARLGCNNSGRAAKIVYHEYGHGIHDHLTWSRHTFDPQVSEGVSDYVAATLTDNPNITGLLGCHRVLPGRTTVRSCVNRYTYCKSHRCHSFPGDEAHNSAPVICGALWEMRQALGATRGDHFFLKFLTLVSDMNSSYEAAIAADEDPDGDPRNGTTHSCEINRAFLGTEGGHGHFPDLVRHAFPCVRSAAAAAPPPDEAAAAGDGAAAAAADDGGSAAPPADEAGAVPAADEAAPAGWAAE